MEQIIALFVFLLIPGFGYLNNVNSGYSNEGSRKYSHEHQYLLITECSNPGFKKRFCCLEIMERMEQVLKNYGLKFEDTWKEANNQLMRGH